MKYNKNSSTEQSRTNQLSNMQQKIGNSGPHMQCGLDKSNIAYQLANCNMKNKSNLIYSIKGFDIKAFDLALNQQKGN